jgi:hypothetical protein
MKFKDLRETVLSFPNDWRARFVWRVGRHFHRAPMEFQTALR